MNLKDILTAVMEDCGFKPPAAFVTSSNDAERALVAMASRSASTISKWQWQALRVTKSYTLTASESYDLPNDYDQLVNNTAWSQSGNRPLELPTNDQMWTYLQNHTGSTGLRYKAKIIGDKLQVLNPNAGDVVSFDYISNKPVIGADGERKSRFNSDGDLWLLDDHMLILDITWRFKRLRGLDYQDDLSEALSYTNNCKATDEGVRTINTNGDAFGVLNEPYYDLYR